MTTIIKTRPIGSAIWVAMLGLKQTSSAMVDPDMAAHAEAVQGMLEYPDEWIY